MFTPHTLFPAVSVRLSAPPFFLCSGCEFVIAQREIRKDSMTRPDTADSHFLARAFLIVITF